MNYEGGMPVTYRALGHFEVTVAATPVGLPSIPNINRVRRAVIRNLDGKLTWTDDGTTPTAGHGMRALANEIIVFDGDFTAFQMISDTSADVRVAYYGV